MFALENFSAMPFAILAFLGLIGALLLSIISSYTKRIRNQKTMKKAMAAPPAYIQPKDPEAELVTQEPQQPATPYQGASSMPMGGMGMGMGLNSDMTGMGMFNLITMYGAQLWQLVQRLMSRTSVAIGRKSADENQSSSFTQAIAVLKKHFGSHGIYELPWFLYIGAPDCGKSTVLESLDLDLPIGKPLFESDEQKPDLKWWFFNRAVVLDVCGRYLLPEPGSHLEKAWGSLLANLKMHRAKRPLDGIILAIPCTELTGEGALASEEIVHRAKKLHSQLWALQNALAMKTPIYITLTKADTLPGYASFAAALPPQQLDQMLGWSCPFALEAPYAPGWIDTFFQTLDETLQNVRAELYSVQDPNSLSADLFIFKVELKKLRERLALYLNNIFHESAYHDSFFLRGIYLTGDTASHTAMGAHRRDEKYWLPPTALGYAIETPFAQHDARKAQFINNLFAEKIFREYVLGRPVKTTLISTNKLVLSAQVGMTLFLITWGGGLILAIGPLRQSVKTLLPVMAESNETMNNLLFKKFDISNNADAAYLNDQPLKILQLMQNAVAGGTRSIFLVPSWFGKLDETLKTAFTHIWNRILLYSFHSSLQQKAQQLFIVLNEIAPSQGTRQTYINPVQSPEFEMLYTYIKDIIQFERAVKKFNELEKTQDLRDVGLLVTYLYHYDLSNLFYVNSALYNNAIRYTHDTSINLHDFTNIARRKFDALTSAFQAVSFDTRRNIGDVEKVRIEFERLKSISESRRNESADHTEGTALIMRVAQSLDSKDFKWIESHSFAPGPEFSEVVSLIANSRILGLHLADRLADTMNEEFTRYKAKLKEIRLPDIGKLVMTEGDENDVKANASASYKIFVEGLQRFLEQKYMQPIRKVERLQEIPTERYMVWDRGTLERVAALVQTFEDYIVNETVALPDTHRMLLEHLGRVSVRQQIFHALGQSQSFRDKLPTPSKIEVEESLYEQIKSLKSIYPLLRKTVDKSYVASAIGDDVAHMRKVMSEYGTNLLEQADLLLAKDALYAINEEAFNVWNGRDLLGLAAFGAFDLEEVQKYLLAQRERVFFIAKNFASPVIAFLKLKFLDGAPKNAALIHKWEIILAQMEDYEKASPNNTVKKLERFVEYDLNSITGTSCLGLIETGLNQGTSQDFFVQTRNQLRTRVVERCSDIVKGRARKNYLALAQFFNSYISNKFPFTTDPRAVNATEADIQDLKTFIELYDLMTTGEKRAIRMFFDRPGLRETPTNFLTQLDNVMPFLKAAIGYVGVGESASPKILFNVDFDVRKSSESGREYIVERIVDVANRPLSSNDSKQQGAWSVNDVVKIKFRWASGKSSSRVPRKDADQPNMEVEDGTLAAFTYRGRWSLLKMIRTHASSIKENDPAQPVVLHFEVPTALDSGSSTPSTAAREGRLSFASLFLDVYMLTANAVNPDDAGGEKPTPLAFPVFPFRAPLLDNFESSEEQRTGTRRRN